MQTDDLTIFRDGRRCSIALTNARKVKDGETERWEFAFDFPPATTERGVLRFERILQDLGIQLGAGDYAGELRTLLLMVWNARGVEDSKIVERLQDGDLKPSEVVRDILKLSR